MYRRELRSLIQLPAVRRRWLLPALAGICSIGALLLVAVPVLRWLALSLVFLWLAVRRPIWALALLPFAVAFGSLFQVTMAGIHVGPTDLLLAALLVGWAMRGTSVTDTLLPREE